MAPTFAPLLLRAAEFERRRNKSDDFFESGVIPSLRIEIASTNMAHLRSDARTYVPATVRDGERVYEQVGVHLKGAAGSSKPLDANPALTLNFDKFREGQKFQGMDKLHLNNSVQDPSFMTEAICSELFLAAGVPTARTTHARVWLNGRDLGLYVLKEGYDRTFLKRHFKNSNGNLYDGGFLHDITDRLHRKPGEGDVPNYRDLRAVVAASREPDQARRFTRLEQVLDVDRFLSFVAIEILTEHWDGYTIKRNNYRVYHDPDSGRCVFIPHGMDQMFWRDDRALIPGPEPEGGLVARALLETEEGRNRYRERLSAIVTNFFTSDRLTNHLRQLQARLRPVLASISEEKARAYDNAVAHLRREILARLSRVHRMMSDKPPVTLAFSKGGLALLKDWRAVDFRETSLLDQIALDGCSTLHVQATTNGPCTGSWRSSLRISPGHYVFEGRVRTKGVVAIAEDRSAANTGTGAGIRISKPKGQNSGRGKGALGDTEWQAVHYEFTVGDQIGDYDLVCELRAAQGEAWFDLSSLQLRRISQ